MKTLQAIMDGGVPPIGSSRNTSAAFWAYKSDLFNIPLGTSPRSAAAYLDYKRSNVSILPISE